MQVPLLNAKRKTEPFELLKKSAADARLPFDKDAWLNVAFFLDEQYVEWASDAMVVRRIQRPEGFENTPRPVQNKIMHFVLSKHASALQSRPTADVLPVTDDPMDVSDANVSLAYLRWLADPQQTDFDGVLADAVLWALTAGEGYLKWTYNAKEKRGEICSCSPLDVYADPYVKKFSDSRWIIHSQFMDVEQVFDIYGKEIKPTQMQRADVLKTALLRDMGQAPVLQGTTVNELWMKPSRRYPNGLFVVWAGDEFLVEPRDFPYAHKHLPFTQIGSIPRPGSPHYTCAVKYLRGPQMELNKYHAQRIMVREAYANPKWWIPSDLELEEDPDDSPRQILRGNSNGGQLRPEILQGTSFPVGDEGQFIIDEMMHTAGQHEVSQGQVPGRVEAAKAIEALKEADRSHEAELLRTIKSSITEGFWQQLELARQYVSEEILVTCYSKDGMPEVKHFKGTHAKAGQRIQVTMGTGLARTRAAREEQVMNMWQNQIIRDPEVAAELLDLPIGVISPNRSHDIRLARNENLTMQSGTPVKPNSWDDHEIHLREHNNFRKSHDYLGASDEAKKIFEFHCETHDMLQVEELKKQALKLQIAQAAAQPPGAEPAQTQPGQSGEPPAPPA